jgi:hypothetical protein
MIVEEKKPKWINVSGSIESLKGLLPGYLSK